MAIEWKRGVTAGAAAPHPMSAQHAVRARLSIAEAERAAASRQRRTRPGAVNPVAQGGLVGHALRYSKEIDGVLRREVSAINELGQRYANCRSEILAGWVAEADHVGTFNVDARFLGRRVMARRAEVYGPKSVDIVVTGHGGDVALRASAKVCGSATRTADCQRGYGDMERLVPADQVAEVRTYSARQAAKEAMKDGANRPDVLRQRDEVAGHATDRLRADGVESRARTRRESQELGQKAKTGSVGSADIVGDISTRARQGAVCGARNGLLAGLAVAGALGSVRFAVDLARGETRFSDGLVNTGKIIAAQTAHAMSLGAASGAATAAARVVAERASSQIAKRILGSSAPAVAAICIAEVGINGVQLAIGNKTRAEFRDDVRSTCRTGAVSMAGAEIGFLLLGPLGAIIGGFCAPFVFGWSAKLFTGR